MGENNKNKFDLEITPTQGPVKKIILQTVDLTKETKLGLEELPKTFPSPLGRWAQVYAIDPTELNFTQGLVTVEAKGSNLYKCKDYNFSDQNCFGEWILFKENLTPRQEYTFILTAEDPVFAEQVSTCDAENSAGPGVFATACDASDGSLLESDDSLVETQTYTKSSYAGLRIQSVDATVTNCDSITSVILCYERWISASTALNCDVSIDANGDASYTAVTTTCPTTGANPGVTCTDVTSIGETFGCGSFFGAAGTRAVAKMENERQNAGAPSTETTSTDVFYFNITYVEAGESIMPNITLENPLVPLGTKTPSTSKTINLIPLISFLFKSGISFIMTPHWHLKRIQAINHI